MKTTLLSRLVAPGLTAALALTVSSLVGEELYSGQIRLTGEMQNAAKPGSISFVYTGQLRGGTDPGGTTRKKANVSGGGLFRSTSDAIVNATFKGELTTYSRLASNTDRPGKLVKKVRPAQVTTSRRFVRFPGGSVTLDRPINGTRTEKQRISGSGTYRERL